MSKKDDYDPIPKPNDEFEIFIAIGWVFGVWCVAALVVWLWHIL